jgi:hypothetical protein
MRRIWTNGSNPVVTDSRDSRADQRSVIRHSTADRRRITPSANPPYALRPRVLRLVRTPGGLPELIPNDSTSTEVNFDGVGAPFYRNLCIGSVAEYSTAANQIPQEKLF